MKYSLLLLNLFLSACLLTQSDIDKQTSASPPPPSKAPPAKAPPPAAPPPVLTQQRDLKNELRHLRGRVEMLEHTQAKTTLAVHNLLTKTDQISQKQAAVLLAKTPPPAAPRSTKSSSQKSQFEQAEHAFQNQQWKQAVVLYEQYRTTHKTGRFYKKATLQIGKAFQKLNMNKEAKSFFTEVINVFPKSSEAKQAKALLKK